MIATTNITGFPMQIFHFANLEEKTQWNNDMASIRNGAANLNRFGNAAGITAWLQTVNDKTLHWGDDRIPEDIKAATEITENYWAAEGNLVAPLFRDSIPKLVSAQYEMEHAVRGSSFLHVYKARNGDRQEGMGVPDNLMIGFNRNRLKYAEITYVMSNSELYTIRAANIFSGRQWREWIVATWSSLAAAYTFNDELKNICYRQILDVLHRKRDNLGDGSIPCSIRDAIHELEDKFGEVRTQFQPPVTTTTFTFH